MAWGQLLSSYDFFCRRAGGLVASLCLPHGEASIPGCHGRESCALFCTGKPLVWGLKSQRILRSGVGVVVGGGRGLGDAMPRDRGRGNSPLNEKRAFVTRTDPGISR